MHSIVSFFDLALKRKRDEQKNSQTNRTFFYFLNYRGLCGLSSDVMFANGGNLMLISG